jgi:hypothetical protein
VKVQDAPPVAHAYEGPIGVVAVTVGAVKPAVATSVTVTLSTQKHVKVLTLGLAQFPKLFSAVAVRVTLGIVAPWRTVTS